MISHKFACVFVHVPKTAGTSIEKLFLRLHGLTWDQRDQVFMRVFTDPPEGPDRMTHMTLEEYRRFGYLSEPYFSFCFVRNPWDRLLSEYRYRFSHAMDFPTFVDRSLGPYDPDSEEGRHIMPQSAFAVDVDFVGRFETLREDFSKVASRLSLPSSRLDHHNIGEETKASIAYRKMMRVLFRRDPGKPKVPYQSYYTPDLRDRVAEFYAEDISRFGYRFEEPSYCTGCAMDVLPFNKVRACDCTEAPYASPFPKSWA